MVPKGDKLPQHSCPICGCRVTCVEYVGGWSEIGGGGGLWYNAKCVPCSIDFRLDVRNGVPGAWRMLAPPKASLAEPIGPETLDRLNAKLLRYRALGRTWADFLAKRHLGDELWRYRRDNGRDGVTIVRNGTPIAGFSCAGDF